MRLDRRLVAAVVLVLALLKLAEWAVRTGAGPGRPAAVHVTTLTTDP
ncbi:MAG: hypothetical protein N2422_02110 [Rhodobacteraceae bacterium]|nr:hypothetical protein [Paracoccaceae bacterium]